MFVQVEAGSVMSQIAVVACFVSSVARKRPKLDKLSSVAIRDAPRLDKAVRSQSDTESSSEEDDDDPGDFSVTRNDDDVGDGGTAAEAVGAIANISVSCLSLTQNSVVLMHCQED